MAKISKFLTILLLLTVFAGLSSCGKTSRPVPLEGSGYPHSYPRV